MKSGRVSYHTFTSSVAVTAWFGCAALCGCSSGGGSNGASTGGPSGTTSPASGPLALAAGNGQRATYTFDDGAKELLDFPGDHVKVSASCAKPDGSLDCEAMRLLRRGKSVQLAPNEISAGLPPGAVVCRKLNIVSTVGRSPSGSEDGFCVFGDGSLAAHGSVESHVLQAP